MKKGRPWSRAGPRKEVPESRGTTELDMPVIESKPQGLPELRKIRDPKFVAASGML